MTPEPAPLPIELREDCVLCWIHVTPRARRPGIGGLHGDALRVAVAAAPESGAANAACIESLARALGVRRSEVSLEAGARGRRKRVRVEGSPEQLAARLRGFARSGGDR